MGPLIKQIMLHMLFNSQTIESTYARLTVRLNNLPFTKINSIYHLGIMIYITITMKLNFLGPSVRQANKAIFQMLAI